MKNLQKALDIDPNYDDAMAYMNLSDPREGRSGRYARTVQSRHRKRRQVGSKGARHQEDEGQESGASAPQQRWHHGAEDAK